MQSYQVSRVSKGPNNINTFLNVETEEANAFPHLGFCDATNLNYSVA